MSGIFSPLRIYDFDSDLPELSNNGFYCKEYDHVEYFVLNPNQNRIPPFVILFEGKDESPILGGFTMQLFCSETKELAATVTVDIGDFSVHFDGDDVFLIYDPSNDFTLSDDVDPGVYFLKIGGIVLDTTYQFYTDSFVIKKHINGTP